MNQNDPNVFAYVRRAGDSTVLVALNMSAQAHTVAFDLGAKGIRGTTLNPLYLSSDTAARPIPMGKVVLEAFGALVAEIK